jgi:hypothetical protein
VTESIKAKYGIVDATGKLVLKLSEEEYLGVWENELVLQTMPFISNNPALMTKVLEAASAKGALPQ